MVLLGAREKTAAEIAASIGLDLSKNEEDLRQLMATGSHDLIGAVTALKRRGIELNTANAFFVQKDYAVNNFWSAYYILIGLTLFLLSDA